MKIQIWSDITCPYCYLGKHHLEKAIMNLHIKGNIEIIWRSFELDPYAKTATSESLYSILANKFSISENEAKQMTEQIVQRGKLVSLDFNFASLRPVNTFDAHRLVHFAAEFGLMTEMQERLFQAYFTESLNIADQTLLAQLADQVGISADGSYAMLSSTSYKDGVRADEKKAEQLDIQSVPFFDFGSNQKISGAQPVHVFEKLVTRLQQRSLSINNSRSDDGSFGNSCDSNGTE